MMDSGSLTNNMAAASVTEAPDTAGFFWVEPGSGMRSSVPE